MTQEEQRLKDDRERKANWKRWGPYLSERQWGTVREDYSPSGTPWEYFIHDHARSRTYRWGEDGIGGICDNPQRLCFALALWNGRDAILKERLFGLTGREGNHGEDVKELYWYADSSPTHSWMRFIYKYPLDAFPYAQLVQDARQTYLMGVGTTHYVALTGQYFFSHLTGRFLPVVSSDEFNDLAVIGKGDLLIWDNRCSMHARTDFPREEVRMLRRCTVLGGPVVAAA